MKKLVYAILFAVTVSVSARDINLDEARRAASGFWNISPDMILSPANAQRATGRGQQASSPEYYVLNNEKGGWTIIAGDDRINPVIAYSETGSFNPDDMPDNVAYWMKGVKLMVDSVRNTDSKPSGRISQRWNRLLSDPAPETSEKKEIETALWSQSYPYNKYCPIASADNSRAVTGCLATAMGIVMRYYEWPVQGKGIIGGYVDGNSTYIPAYSIDNHVYDWSSMPLTNGALKSSDWSLTAQNNVANLLHDCGVMIEMTYSSYGSAAISESVPSAMAEHMSYSDNIQYIARSSFTIDSWFSILRKEIDAGRLVIYGGQGDGGGHAFVCDGYDTSGNMLRFNWGWGGTYNGYYTLDLMYNDYISFPRGQSAIIGIAPSGTETCSEDLSGIMLEYFGLYGLTPLSISFRKGSEVSFMLGYFMNTSPKPVTISARICLMDSDGNERAQIGDTCHLSFEELGSKYFRSWETDPVVMPIEPALTDYFQLFISNDDVNWSPFRIDLFPDREYVVCGVTPDPLILVPSDCSVGETIDLGLSYGFDPVKTVKWYIDGEKIEGNTVVLKSGVTEIKAEIEYYDDSKGTIVKKLKL